MGIARSLLVAAVFLCASVARAESDGVPFIDGQWSGKIKAAYFDQTSAGSNKPKQKYRDKVDVTISQTAGTFDFVITFKDGLPTGGGQIVTTAFLEGSVGNFYLSLGQQPGVKPLLLGSGKINKRAKQMKIRGVAASDDYTFEFQITLRKRGN